MNNDYDMVESLNVLDEELLPCSQDPLTGFSEMPIATHARQTLAAIRFAR